MKTFKIQLITNNLDIQLCKEIPYKDNLWKYNVMGLIQYKDAILPE